MRLLVLLTFPELATVRSLMPLWSLLPSKLGSLREKSIESFTSATLREEEVFRLLDDWEFQIVMLKMKEAAVPCKIHIGFRVWLFVLKLISVRMGCVS